MSGTRLTSAQKAEMLEDWMAGRPCAWIAEKYGVDPSYPGLLAKRRGLPVGESKRRLREIQSAGTGWSLVL